MACWQKKLLHEWVEAGDIELGRGDVISKNDINAHPGNYPIYSSSAHNNGKFGEYAKFMFDEELITWSVDGGGNLFYRPKHKFSVTNVCGYMRIVSPSLHARFIYYCLAEQHEHLSFDYTLKAHPSVIRKIYSLPDISLRRQRKIARILQTIDQTIEKTQALIEKYQQIKAGLMHDLFTRGIGSDGQLRPCREQSPELYQETPIGWIPRGWVFASFGSKIDVIDPNPSHRYPDSVDYGCPICSTENFLGADSFSVDTAKTVPESTFLLQNARCQFTPDDVIFARKGKIGLARRYGNDKKVFSHTVVVMKPLGDEVNARWLLWLARSNWLISGIEKTMNTNLGVPTLGVEFIKKIPVPFPSLEEQKAADGALQTITDKLGTVEKELKKLKEKKSGLMHDLLTGAVSVSVEPKEEHAVETV